MPARLRAHVLDERGDVAGQHEGPARDDADVRIDALDEQVRRVDFAHADRFRPSERLPVNVARRDLVAVDDDDRSYSAARERLDAVRAHAARAHDHDGRGPLTREPRGAPEDFEPRCSRFFVHAYIVAGRARRLLRCAATARRPARRGPSSCSAAAHRPARPRLADGFGMERALSHSRGDAGLRRYRRYTDKMLWIAGSFYMAEFIYQMYQARKAHGDKVILDDVTLSFYPGAKIGVVGPNGMGKSTLLKIMAGKEEVSNGDARLTPGYTVGLLEQEPPLDDDKTVIENVRMAFGDLLAKVDRFNKIGEEMAEPDADFDALMAEMGKLQDEIDAADGWDIDSKLGQAMDALQLPDSDMPVKVLSGGERQRISIARAILKNSPILLLDEATASLDIENELAVKQAIANLLKEKKTVVMIAHTLSIVKNADQILVVADGKIAEAGTHEELLAKNGKYAAMWQAEKKYPPEGRTP